MNISGKQSGVSVGLVMLFVVLLIAISAAGLKMERRGASTPPAVTTRLAAAALVNQAMDTKAAVAQLRVEHELSWRRQGQLSGAAVDQHSSTQTSWTDVAIDTDGMLTLASATSSATTRSQFGGTFQFTAASHQMPTGLPAAGTGPVTWQFSSLALGIDTPTTSSPAYSHNFLWSSPLSLEMCNAVNKVLQISTLPVVSYSIASDPFAKSATPTRVTLAFGNYAHASNATALNTIRIRLETLSNTDIACLQLPGTANYRIFAALTSNRVRGVV